MYCTVLNEWTAHTIQRQNKVPKKNTIYSETERACSLLSLFRSFLRCRFFSFHFAFFVSYADFPFGKNMKMINNINEKQFEIEMSSSTFESVIINCRCLIVTNGSFRLRECMEIVKHIWFSTSKTNTKASHWKFQFENLFRMHASKQHPNSPHYTHCLSTVSLLLFIQLIHIRLSGKNYWEQ